MWRVIIKKKKKTDCGCYKMGQRPLRTIKKKKKKNEMAETRLYLPREEF